VFPAILAIIILAIPNRAVQGLFSGAMPERVPRRAQPGDVSNRFRLWALVLTGPALVGVCGLQRFYVGKIGTGILWFFTGGLLGLGQIYDIAMIAMGDFRDKHGRKLVVWQSFDELKGMPAGSIAGPTVAAPLADRRDPAGPAQVAESAGAEGAFTTPAADTAQPAWSPLAAYSEPARERARTNLPLAILGHGMVLPALAIGLFWALRVPELIAAGFPDASLAREFDQMFGYSGWPRLLDRLASTLAMLFLLAAVILLTLARRRAGAAHTGRAVLAAIGLVFTAMLLYETFYRVNWAILMSKIDEDQIGPAIEQFLDYANPKSALVSAVMLVGSILMLAWPEKRRTMVLPASGSGAF